MISVLFVCLGNICRSPMAELVFRDMVSKRGLSSQFRIASAATSGEEVGNPIYPKAIEKLTKEGVTILPHFATQLCKNDCDKYDFLVAMEARNIRAMKRILGESEDEKIVRLLDFSQNPRDISDPWYTGNFDVAFDDIVEGCEAFLKYILFNKT